MDDERLNNCEVALTVEEEDDANDNDVALLGPSHVIDVARKAFKSGKTLSIPFRRTQLKRMLKMIVKNKEKIIKAVDLDLRMPRGEAALTEVEVLRVELNKLLRNLSTYTQKKRVPLNLGLPFDSAFTKSEPYGLVLVLGTWNFPFMTTLQPVAGAIAAGNCVIIKPSEFAPNSCRLIAQLIGQYLDRRCYHVIEADLEQTRELLTNKFDYIFATGSTSMGRAVLEAAAAHLTPTTLELGGKSPVYIHDSCLDNIKITTKRIMWGKLCNLGQTCVGPDYILCSKIIEAAFLAEAKDLLKEWYGEKVQGSRYLARIINAKHFNRLVELLQTTNGNLVLGGEYNEATRWIAPTIFGNNTSLSLPNKAVKVVIRLQLCRVSGLVDVAMDDVLMKDEIFGPILPIVTVEDPYTAMDLIKSRPKPLALYIFSTKSKIVDMFVERTSSGGICVNDVNLQAIRDNLPFGGVGDSGLGAYHGKYTFKTFSHKKSILWRQLNGLDEKLVRVRYPPYSSRLSLNLMKYGLRTFYLFNVRWQTMLYFLSMGAGGLIMLLLLYFDVITVTGLEFSK